MVGGPAFLQKNMNFKLVFEGILIFVGPNGLDKKNVEGFLAVRMDLPKIFLKAFLKKIEKNEVGLKG